MGLFDITLTKVKTTLIFPHHMLKNLPIYFQRLFTLCDVMLYDIGSLAKFHRLQLKEYSFKFLLFTLSVTRISLIFHNIFERVCKKNTWHLFIYKYISKIMDVLSNLYTILSEYLYMEHCLNSLKSYRIMFALKLMPFSKIGHEHASAYYLFCYVLVCP